MAKIISLDNRNHRHLKINTAKVESHGADVRTVPVMLSEFLKLAVQYPIVFTKNSETGQFVCVAVFGFEEDENLFWQNSEWNAIYTPLNIVRQPFFIGADDKPGGGRQGEEFIICIDTDSECIVEDEGEALFNEDGEETPYLLRMKAVLAELLNGEAETRTFAEKLLQLELLMPMSLDITFANGQPQRVQGMYAIDEKRLKSLPEAAVLELHSLDYLGPIYTMIASLEQIYSLVHKKNALLAKGGQWFRQGSG